MSAPIHDPVERVRERAREGEPPSLVHPGWARTLPWLVQGTTTRGPGPEPFDLGLFSGGSPEAEIRRSWEALRRATGAEAVVHARQVHGAEVGVWTGRPGVPADPSASGGSRSGARRIRAEGALRGPVLVEPRDGHVTADPGVLLAVTTADCVPVFVVDPERRAVGLLHAGWRGAAAGILEEGLATMRSAFGTDPADVHIHLGPAICGRCYEVGPEVFEALGRPVPDAPTPVDLRGVLAERAMALGVRAARVSVSKHCTLCTGSELFSHRGGDACRQVGYLGIRP